MRRAIPIFFHGDGVPTTGVGKSWGKTLNVFDWGSLLARGATQQIVFWIWSVFAQVASPRAMRLFWKIMKWSFNALFSGKHPCFVVCRHTHTLETGIGGGEFMKTLAKRTLDNPHGAT